MKQCVCIRLDCPVKLHQEPMLLTYTTLIDTQLLSSTYAPQYLYILTVSSKGYYFCEDDVPFYRPSILTPFLPISRFIVPLCSFLFSYIPFHRPSMLIPILPISLFIVPLLSLLFFLYPLLISLFCHSYSSYIPFYRSSILTPTLPICRFIVPLFSLLFSYSPLQLNVCPISRSLLGMSDLRQWKSCDRWVTNQPSYLCVGT